MSNAPIGIFDSGVGGLTVARAILDQLPNESTIYIGDTARGPYGPRPLAEVREFALETLDFLVEQGVKALVIACNTASVAMLRDARERYKVPVIEVIQPAVRRAVAASSSGHIGVIGTRATVDSKAYLDAFAAAPQLHVTSIACPLFVEYVERGETSGAEITKIARDYLAPVMEAKVDTLVLGCTHYPLLTGVISYVMGDGVTLVSSAEETAKDMNMDMENLNSVNDVFNNLFKNPSKLMNLVKNVGSKCVPELEIYFSIIKEFLIEVSQSNDEKHLISLKIIGHNH